MAPSLSYSMDFACASIIIEEKIQQQQHQSHWAQFALAFTFQKSSRASSSQAHLFYSPNYIHIWGSVRAYAKMLDDGFGMYIWRLNFKRLSS